MTREQVINPTASSHFQTPDVGGNESVTEQPRKSKARASSQRPRGLDNDLLRGTRRELFANSRHIRRVFFFLSYREYSNIERTFGALVDRRRDRPLRREDVDRGDMELWGNRPRIVLSLGAMVDRLDDLSRIKRVASYRGKLRYVFLDCQANFSSILRGMSVVLTLPPAALIASNQGGAHQVNHKPTHRYPTPLHTGPGTRTRIPVDKKAHRAARNAISSIRIAPGCKRKNWNVGPLFSKLRWIA